MPTTLQDVEIALGAIAESIVCIDAEAAVRWANAAFTRLVERPHGELLGRPLPVLLALEELGTRVPADMHPASRALSEGGTPGAGLYRLVGDAREFAIHWTPLATPGGGAVLTLHDVTAQRTAEAAREDDRRRLEAHVADRTAELARANAALRWSDERYRTLFDSVPDVIFTADDGGTITSLNPAFTRVTGSPVEAWIGRGVDELVHPDDVARGREWVRQVLRGAPPAPLELRVVTPEREIMAEFNVRPFVERDELLGVFGIFRDVTERHEIERQKDAFLSTVSHELRTPLASVRGFLELLLSRDFPADERQQFLGIMQQETLRLMRLVDAVLELQRYARGGVDLTLADVALGPLVAAAVAAYRRADVPLDVRATVPDDLPAVRAEAAAIGRVLDVLLSNAVKFSPDGGTVTVEARADDARVVVSVSDEGVGIPPDAVPKMFGRFFRADDALTRRTGGAGLGLALASEIVRAHGGRIWADGDRPRGARVSFALPAAARPRAAEVAA